MSDVPLSHLKLKESQCDISCTYYTGSGMLMRYCTVRCAYITPDFFVICLCYYIATDQLWGCMFGESHLTETEIFFKLRLLGTV